MTAFSEVERIVQLMNSLRGINSVLQKHQREKEERLLELVDYQRYDWQHMAYHCVQDIKDNRLLLKSKNMIQYPHEI